jgi:DNA-binding protein HU-beta
MTRSNLIEQIAGSSGRTRKEAEEMIDAVLGHIAAALAKGEKVDLRGFGSFQVNAKNERQGRNPKTGEMLTIPARKVAVFKPGKELSLSVNEARAPGEETSASGSMPAAQLSPGSAKVHGDKLETGSDE